MLENSGGDVALSESLTRWAQESAKPLVLLIDEIDALVGDTLISALRQLRAGYAKRPARFPVSVVLCGVRDVRDYRIHSSREQGIITGGSAFNIKAESLRMGDFNRQEVERLYQQHTDETAQPFDHGVLEAVWEYTHGQPWLVNALGYEVCFRMTAGRNRTLPITVDMIQEAKEQLIVRRETHLDQLVDKLQEDRVRRVIHPMLQGEDFDDTVLHDDIQYVTELGLIRRDEAGLHIANDMYREIIPRELTTIFQLNLESTIRPAWYMTPDGSLDMSQLLTGFQQFFREHSESWLERFNYKEARPQLLLQAFLQRIVNGGGRIDREYGLGRRRADLLVIWPFDGGTQHVVIETKLRRGALQRTLQQGVEQTRGYMDRCGADEGHLVIFDRDASKVWEEKLFMREETYRDKIITVWGM